MYSLTAGVAWPRRPHELPVGVVGVNASCADCPFGTRTEFGRPLLLERAFFDGELSPPFLSPLEKVNVRLLALDRLVDLLSSSTSSFAPAPGVVCAGSASAGLEAPWSCLTKSALTLRVNVRILSLIGSGTFLEASTLSNSLSTILGSSASSSLTDGAFDLPCRAATAAMTLEPRFVMFNFSFGGCSLLLPLADRSEWRLTKAGRSVGLLVGLLVGLPRSSSSLLMRRALSSDLRASMLLLALLTFLPSAPMKLSVGANTVLRGRSLAAGLKLG
jgi:hypothetical protein